MGESDPRSDVHYLGSSESKIMMNIPLTKLSFKELTYFGGPTPLTDLLVPKR